MKKICTFILLLFNCFFTISVKADTILTCEAARHSAEHQNLKIVSYPVISPTIIIGKENKQIRYFFSEHGQQWNYNYAIVEENQNNILGIKDFEAGDIEIISLNLKTMEFSAHFTHDSGTQLTFGKCFK